MDEVFGRRKFVSNKDSAREPRGSGGLWESRSGGKGAFLVVEKVIDGSDMRAQMLEKVAVAR